jgi:arsenate reductase
MINVWLNLRCSQARAAIRFLEENGIIYSVREYLKEWPNKEELQYILDKLTIIKCKLIFKKELLFKKLGLQNASKEELHDTKSKYVKSIKYLVASHKKAIIAIEYKKR